LKKIFTLNFLRIVALIVVLAGTAASLVLMFNAGRNQKSIFLIVLFTIWVLSPFIALVVANVIAKRWSIPARVSLYLLMLFITLGSLFGYSGLLNPPGTKPAFKFIIIPLVSWLLIVIVFLIAASRSRMTARKSIDPK
jgi:hypothetical protein